MKLFVWDFHGVLERGNDLAVVEVTNHIFKQFGYTERLSIEIVYKLYGCKWYEYFEKLVPYENHQKHLVLQSACYTLSNNHPEVFRRHIKPNDYADQVINAIHKHHQQILISNTTPYGLVLFIQAVKLNKFFTYKNAFAVDTDLTNTKSTKKHILRSYLHDKRFDKIIVIGDSPADIELAEYENCVSYLYSHPERDFRQCSSTYKINDLRDILREI